MVERDRLGDSKHLPKAGMLENNTVKRRAFCMSHICGIRPGGRAAQCICGIRPAQLPRMSRICSIRPVRVKAQLYPFIAFNLLIELPQLSISTVSAS